MKTTRTLFNIKLAVLGGSSACLLALSAGAQPSAHYVPGVEGLKAASLPPPGLYLKDYNVGYWSTTLNGPNGDELTGLGVDPHLYVYANVPRVIWITDFTLLGGFIGVDALVPFQYTEARVPGLDNSTFGIGDLFGEVTWSWHPKNFDISLAYGAYAPTGEFSSTDPTEPGLGYWTHLLTAGATWFIGEEKRWSISALNRYEFNTEQDDTHITKGQVYTLEGGVSMALSKTLDVGLVGYYQLQTTPSSNQPDDSRARVGAVGAEAGMFYPRYNLGWSLRYLYEFMAENRFQGHTAALTIVKVF